MFKCLALLILCIAAWFDQAGQSLAHVDEVQTRVADGLTSRTELTPSPVQNDDCPPGASCCVGVCMSCYLPLPALQNALAIVPTSSHPIRPYRDCLRSTILARDPPVPRIFFF